MPHKKGRGGQKKIKVRDMGSKIYPHRMDRCTVNIAIKCKGWVNANTMPTPGICKRCWQVMNARK
ncbi:MAG: hypothetical protein KGD60_15035 [Candidatus Thorarchaeota archaeon]|nr:hypothetical protein [Candidatus Thorarchaeota archaeon]